jgi:hypothetical protein
MKTIHAWFSADTALRVGSAVFRKPDGDRVNVTRVNVERESKSSHSRDENYLGQVVGDEDGGCIQAIGRVRGISD